MEERDKEDDDECYRFKLKFIIWLPTSYDEIEGKRQNEQHLRPRSKRDWDRAKNWDREKWRGEHDYILAKELGS